MKNRIYSFILFSVIVFTSFASTQPLSEGDNVCLKAYSDLGIPLHPGSGDRKVSDRLPDASIAKIESIDQSNGWVRISSGNISGWIVQKYIDYVIVNTLDGEQSYVVGCWNLEHFHEGNKRGFPENTQGGPSYDSRGQVEYETIASIIENLEARILVLEEIYAKETDNSYYRSDEMDRLIAILGDDYYDYIISASGRSQHIAILYDERYVRLNNWYECDFPEEEINGKDVFERQPLCGHFTFMQNGQPMNDLLVIGVHLASGQKRRKNHDRAMEMIVQDIENARDDGLIPNDEYDILLAGDYNANRFDDSKEKFWDDMEGEGWNVLADSKDTYHVTRLSGVPLMQDFSIIDYIIVSAGDRGLYGEEIDSPEAKVHEELIGTSAENFRQLASDHLPVTVRIKVALDSDFSTE